MRKKELHFKIHPACHSVSSDTMLTYYLLSLYSFQLFEMQQSAVQLKMDPILLAQGDTDILLIYLP